MSSAPDSTPSRDGTSRPAGKVVHMQRGRVFACVHCGEWTAAPSDSSIEMEAKQSQWVQRVIGLLLLVLLIGQVIIGALLYRHSEDRVRALEHWRTSDD